MPEFRKLTTGERAGKIFKGVMFGGLFKSNEAIVSHMFGGTVGEAYKKYNRAISGEDMDLASKWLHEGVSGYGDVPTEEEIRTWKENASTDDIDYSDWNR